mmetsp:Transcript_123861/g.396505  ORF Transcript_123861/g.396505 Transcript_123861/m.396505 type:complete len:299 (-) Transcript_123861:711-1607(-)
MLLLLVLLLLLLQRMPRLPCLRWGRWGSLFLVPDIRATAPGVEVLRPAGRRELRDVRDGAGARRVGVRDGAGEAAGSGHKTRRPRGRARIFLRVLGGEALQIRARVWPSIRRGITPPSVEAASNWMVAFDTDTENVLRAKVGASHQQQVRLARCVPSVEGHRQQLRHLRNPRPLHTGSEAHLVFVYEQLREGFPNHDLLKEDVLVGLRGQYAQVGVELDHGVAKGPRHHQQTLGQSVLLPDLVLLAVDLLRLVPNQHVAILQHGTRPLDLTHRCKLSAHVFLRLPGAAPSDVGERDEY